MSVLIICFSCVSAFADTTLDDNGSSYDKVFFSKKVFTDDVLSNVNVNLKKLPANDNGYITVVTQEFSSTGEKTTCIMFIPNSNREVVKVANLDFIPTSITDDKIYIAYYASRDDLLCRFKGDYYSLFIYDGGCSFVVNQQTFGNNHGFAVASHSDWGQCNKSFVSDPVMRTAMEHHSYYKDYISSGVDYEGYVRFGYNEKLFSIVVQLVPGYSGHIIDTSFEGLLADKGLTCDNSILKNYKYQISYIKNNDLVMMFLNNNKKPDLKIEDYKDGLNTNSKKYTFTYNSVYDTIVYFPQYQKYLNYDDWYSSESVPKDFRWFWSEDKKSFSLISDWNVSFDDTGKANYNGSRVVVNWKLDESSIDNISLTKSWQVDKEMLKDKGWKEGRPSDQNYPYCVQLWQNNIPVYSVYFNSKPKVRINRESDYYCEYAIDMIGMCGYVYSEWADMSTQFDFTTGKVSKGSDILSQGQNLVWYLFNDLGGRADDSCLLHLYDNYKGDDEHFVGTKVFFNWDVTSNTFDTNLKNDDYDYSKTLLKGGSYKDENGHIHGGDLKQYDDEDLNKWNTNGKDDNNNKDTSSSSDFDFSFEGISEYCKDFWSFMKSALAIFPAFVWTLIFISISVIIALRLLGR